MKQAMSNDIREKIKMYIKNKIDISALIENISIKDEDLSGAVIKYMNRIDDDMSNCNLAGAFLGSEDRTFNVINCKMNNCNFYGAKFVGKVYVGECEAKNCNFKMADIALADYKNTDFSGSTFCGAKICISSKTGIGCTFPKEMWSDLTKNWKQKIKVE